MSRIPEPTRRQRLRELIDDHRRTHGDFTAAELTEARQALYGAGEATAVSSKVEGGGVGYPITVTATARVSGWELRIGDVGVTRVASVGDAEAAVRDYLELDGLDRDAPLDITFKFRGRHAPECERSTLLT
ncbi:hypothetical protein AB0K52_05795 [Glycomyces sp. NPDC049804]|uniref:hypothetical protein n=1 Tax=Glycomyces sp. NPDC049804 TaxID=3154363 RepID=UPI00342CCDF6